MLGIFILLELFISFIVSFCNLIGFNRSVTSIILFISNLAIFAIYGYKNGKTTNKKGFLEGIITGLSMILILFIIALIFFTKNISVYTLIYYIFLLFTAIIFATIGKNKKIDSTLQEKK